MCEEPGAPLSGDTVLSRSPTVLWRAAPGYLVLATLDDEVRRADGPAPEVWALLDRPISVEELSTTLADRHAVSADTVRTDLEPFLTDLLTAGFVQAVDAFPQQPDG